MLVVNVISYDLGSHMYYILPTTMETDGGDCSYTRSLTLTMKT